MSVKWWRGNLCVEGPCSTWDSDGNLCAEYVWYVSIKNGNPEDDGDFPLLCCNSEEEAHAAMARVHEFLYELTGCTP